MASRPGRAAPPHRPPLPIEPLPRRYGLGWFRNRLDEVARTSPARLALSIFFSVVVLFTGLLSLPVATASGRRAPFADALFTATSAVCVTGLSTVDIARYWSGFGLVVVLVGMKVGGLGVLTLASLLGLAISRRLGLRQRLMAASETKALRLGEVGTLLRLIVMVSTSVELGVAVVLFPRFLVLGETVAGAAWHSVFYAVSAFNNVGFSAHPGGLPAETAGDPWVAVPLMVGVFAGSLGFPVLLMLKRTLRPSRWDLHTRLTLQTTLLLLVGAIVLIGGLEWRNPQTLGGLHGGTKALATVFTAVMPRSGGMSVVDVGQMHEATWLVTDALMFVGGGSASTAGGIRVTTLAVIVLAMVAEARGDADVEVGRRRIPTGSLRVAVSVAMAGATMVGAATVVMLTLTGLSLDVVLLEVISAFATCGLSTGITPDLPEPAKYVLVAVMFLGRTGTTTLAGALALRERSKLFRLPEERPIVG
ncbi:MAG: TrkH family potassium uptake protein [Actinomycetes bacterium]